MRNRQAGFTLIEMLVVLVIMSIIGGIVLTRGPARSVALDMQAASGTVASALRLARGRAIATNEPVVVLFNPAAATLQVGSDPARSLPRGFGLAITSAGDQGPAIRFLPDGSSTGGRVVVAGEGRAMQVGVDWLTGRVRVLPAT